MNYLLGLHIMLGTTLLVAFIARYLMVVTHRIAPTTGRRLITILGSALVASGFALVITAHAPLTGACLGALAIIIMVVVLESILAVVGSRQLHSEQ